MGIHRMPRTGALAAATLIALAAALPCFAGTLEIKVNDEGGQPVAQVAVYATPLAPVKKPNAANRTASMDQQHNEFVPHVLLISAGTLVQFPNSDTVSHHVYSFSQAKTFELALYKGNTPPPLAFDEPGVVVVGCNIHDSMLGYIVVVPTEHYALSDQRGMVRLEGVPAGDYTVEVWTPRARPTGLPAAQRVTVTDGVTKLDARITGRLAPDEDHKHGSKSLSWDRY
ncbi:MAG: methylamine utilization protein [Gammaproteobacteria bacterium]